MILRIFRKIFGCYGYENISFVGLEETDEEKKNSEVSSIVGSVLGLRKAGFAGWTEDAMSGVTGNRYVFARYRPLYK